MSLFAGRVGRPHGLDGSFYVVSARAELLIEGRDLEGLGKVVARKGTDERPILTIDVARDRTAIEALRGRELLVDDKHRTPLDEGEYLAEDLVGCHVADGSHSLGDVVRLMAMPSCEVLELSSGVLVPMVKDAIKRIDVENKRIEVDKEFLGAT